MGEMPATQAKTSDVGHALPAEPEQRLRADTYRLLGHLLAAPPDAQTLAIFAAAPVSDDDDMLAVAWCMLATSAGRANPLEVTDEFEALFIGVGRGELMPTTPPQERMPITGASPSSWIAAGKMSPSEPAFSFVRTTKGPFSVRYG